MVYAQDVHLEHSTLEVLVNGRRDISESNELNVTHFKNPAMKVKQISAV